MPFPWAARRAANCRRARDGGILRGGGTGGRSSEEDVAVWPAIVEARLSKGGENMERAEREEGV